MSSRAPKVISFISASGGVGKTKLSLLLAYYLKREQHRRVLFVDMDPTSGASLLVMDEEDFDHYLRRGQTLSQMLRNYLECGTRVRLDDFIVDADLGDVRVDFILPGDDLIDVINQLWLSGAPGFRFREAFRSIVSGAAQGRYDFIIIDTAPFFDPRYVSLSVYVSDLFVVPIRPSLIDLRRTFRMLMKLREDLRAREALEGRSATNLVEVARRCMLGVFNLVPSNPRQAETQFVQGFLAGRIEQRERSSETMARIRRLQSAADRLRDYMRFLRGYLKESAKIGRFPVEYKGVLEEASGYLNEMARILGLPAR